MLNHIQDALGRKNIVWRQHALSRMLERNISREDIFTVVREGEIIESYAAAKPYPGCLIAGSSGNRQIHVVAAWDEAEHAAYIVTAYIPDKDHFLTNGITRKEKL
jgi:hypothetical protein